MPFRFSPLLLDALPDIFAAATTLSSMPLQITPVTFRRVRFFRRYATPLIFSSMPLRDTPCRA